MLFRIFLFLLLLFLIIRFVMRFLFPVLKLTRMTHQKMNEMKQQMDNMGNTSRPAAAKPKKLEGDYIDYEEVK